MVLGVEKIFGHSIVGAPAQPPKWAKVDGYQKIEIPPYAKTEAQPRANFEQFDLPLFHPESRTQAKGQNLYALF